MSSPPMDVDITVISAKHLKNVNWRYGEVIPYAVVYLDPTHRVSTKPDVSGSTRPVWNERFLLPIPDSPPPHTLSIYILHSDTPIGSARVPIPGIEDPTQIHTFELLRPSGRPQGKIRLKLALIPRFAPPVSDCYNSHPLFTHLAPVPRPPPPQQSYTSPPPVQDYKFTPPVSNYYNSHPPPSPLAPPQPPQQSYTPPRPVRDFNLPPPASHNYNLTPSFPRPPPPKKCYTPPPPVEDFKNYDYATAPTYPPPRPLPPQQSPPPISGSLPRHQSYSYSSFYEPYYQSYYLPNLSRRLGLNRQGSYNGEPSAPVDYNAPFDHNKSSKSGNFGVGLTGSMGGLKLEESDLGSTSDCREYCGSYSGQPSAPVDYEGRFDRDRMRENENVGHKAGNDYGEYRGSYGYN